MVKINDLYEQTGKKARMSLTSELPPQMAVATQSTAERVDAPPWCRLGEEEVVRGREAARQLSEELKKVASNQLAADILWRAGQTGGPRYCADVKAVHPCGMAGVYQVQLGDTSRLVIAHGWIKKLGDGDEGRRALEGAAALVVFEERDTAVGQIVSKFDVA